MIVDESWRSNESESCDSHPLSSSFDQAFSQIIKCSILLCGSVQSYLPGKDISDHNSIHPSFDLGYCCCV